MGTLRHTSSGQQVNLGTRVLVGRSTSSALCLADPLVSNEHAVLWWADGRWWVRDLGSRNGTCLADQRLQAGPPYALEPGARLTFGQRDEWRLTDAAPPTILARNLETGALREGRNGLLVLPDEQSSEVIIFNDHRGRWLLESEQRTIELADEARVDTERSSWQISLPLGAASMQALTQEGEHLLELDFRVSADEEHIEFRVRYGRQVFLLEPRVYHYMLLYLARARLEDRANGIADEGWVYTDTLMDALRVDRVTLNQFVFRCRKQLAVIEVPVPGEIIERRPATYQLRVGTPQLLVSRLG